MSRQKSSSLFLIADAQGQLLSQLSAQLSAATDWAISTYTCPAEVMRLDDQDAPNLAVVLCPCPGGRLPTDLIPLLEHAKHHWPSTFFVLGAQGPLPDVDVLFARFGEIPVVDLNDACATRSVVEQEMANSHYGTVRGVPLPGFLQMMEWERKTLGLRVASGTRLGRLHLLEGKLVNAYSHQSRATGEAALLELLTWEDVTLTIERSHHNHQGGPMKPLSALLMEAMRLKDERERHGPTPTPDDFLFGDMEENVFFRRPKSSTAGLTKPQPSPAQPAVTLPGPLPAAPDPSPASFPVPPISSPAASFTPAVQADIPEPRKDSPEVNMANVKDTLNVAISSIDGAMAAALVDYESGMALGLAGSGLDLELAAAGNTEVVRAKMRTMEMLGIKGEIEDILITLQSQYHIIYIVPDRSLFLYLVLAKDKSNLAMARYRLKSLVAELNIS